MTQKHSFFPLVQKFLEQDITKAASIIESMTEDEGAEIIKSLPPLLAVHVIRRLQVSYAAALLKNADEAFLRNTVKRQLAREWGEASMTRLLSNIKEQIIAGIIRGKAASELARANWQSLVVCEVCGKFRKTKCSV